MSDFSDILELQQRLTQAADALEAMAGDEAMARYVIEYDHERRKRCLAVVMTPLIKSGSGVAAAEADARASELYHSAMTQLGKELVAAQKTHCQWEARKIQWETARSLLSMQKSTMQNL